MVENKSSVDDLIKKAADAIGVGTLLTIDIWMARCLLIDSRPYFPPSLFSHLFVLYAIRRRGND